MIRIIQKGHHFRRATCSNCGCIFEYEEEDVIKQDIYDDHGGHTFYGTEWLINCPDCGDCFKVKDCMEK